MKRGADGEITMDDVVKYARIHEQVLEGGTEYWLLDKAHKLNVLVDAAPFDHFFVRGKADTFQGVPLLVDGKACGTLDAPDVAALKKLASPAPFGRGKKTVHDTTVRNAYHIDGERVTIDGLSFEYKFYDTIRKWSGLNIDDHSVLYKLHIYPTGGHFGRHVDTPHGPGHIASGILLLGSPYAGGRLVIEHNGHQESVTAEDVPGTFAAWYTDCPHWVESVTSGDRVVLQYDIVHPIVDAVLAGTFTVDKYIDAETGFFADSGITHPPAVPAILNLIVAEVQVLLTQRKNVAILTDHCYLNKGGLRLETLKGRDKALVDAFTAAGLAVELHACVLRRKGEDDYDVGLLDGPRIRGATICIPGGDKQTMTIFDNPGAEHTGNQSMEPDEAYIHGVIFCRAPHNTKPAPS